MKRQSVARQILSFIGVFLLVLFSGFPGSYPPETEAACPPAINSYWQLEETSGTTFLDSVGGHDAACTVCPDFTTGRVGNALLFDGVEDAVSVPSDAAFNWGPTDDFSIEFWMKTDSSNQCVGNQVIIGRDEDVSNVHWWVGCWGNSGVAAFRLRDKTGKSVLLFGGTPLNDGQWHHVVAVRNGATTENSLFVDGRLEDSKVVVYNDGFAATAKINIGWLNLDGYYRFAGAVDEVALYNQALTETEIQQHYSSGLGYCADIPPAVPQIISPAVTTAFAGWPYVYNVDATGSPAPTFSLTGAPAGMTIDVGSGVIQWTPGSTDTITVSADNSEGTDDQTFTITVLDPSSCPADISHYWRFDETVAGSYADLRWANSAICTDCPSAVAGISNNAQLFRENSMVNVKNDGTFDWEAGDSFSIELWMITDAASTCSGTQVFIGRDDSSTSLQWWLGCSQTGGRARFYLVDREGNEAVVTGTTDLTDGAWHHIAATRDASSNTVNLYVDGALESTAAAVYTAGFYSRTAPVNIGWINLTESYHFVGAIDDLAILNRALSDKEVLQHFTAGTSDLGYCDPLEPSIISTPVTTANELVPYSYAVSAVGNPAPTFSLSVAPAGMTINSATGLISWTPAAGQAGARSVTVTASNSAGSGSQSFVITVGSLPAYSLNITAVNGTVKKSPDQTMFVEGSNVELTAVPDTGYTFTAWGGDLTGTANPQWITMTGNKNVTASFTAITYWSVIAPAAGARVPSGQQTLIQWTAPPEAVNFKLLYSLDSGVTWTLIKKDILARTYLWDIPAFVKDKKKCLLKVVGFTGAGVKVGKIVTGLFTIEGSVKVIAPNGGGKNLASGDSYTIEWQTSASVSGSVAKVVLQYTKDGGATWKKIASLPANPGDPVNPGSYSWTVPSFTKDKKECLVKVTLKDAAGTTIGQDSSDAYFTINP